MKNTQININVELYDSLSELSAEDKMLVDKAQKATEGSYAPYSHFQVGAAVLLENGEVVTGANQENGAYPSGLCAERTALFYAGAKYPNVAVKSIAITAHSGGKFCSAYPCGACRQVMLESQMRAKTPIRVIMAGAAESEVVHSVNDLLPFSFDLEEAKK